MSGYEAAMRDGNGTDGAEALALARDRLRAGAPVVLRPRLVRRMLLLVLCLVLAVGSVVLLVTAPNAIAALGTLLFGTGMLYAALQSLPGRAYLRIAPEGLTVRTPLRRAAGTGTTSSTSPRTRSATSTRRPSTSASTAGTSRHSARECGGPSGAG
jgi:hypothetical protein